MTIVVQYVSLPPHTHTHTHTHTRTHTHMHTHTHTHTQYPRPLTLCKDTIQTRNRKSTGKAKKKNKKSSSSSSSPLASTSVTSVISSHPSYMSSPMASFPPGYAPGTAFPLPAPAYSEIQRSTYSQESPAFIGYGNGGFPSQCYQATSGSYPSDGYAEQDIKPNIQDLATSTAFPMPPVSCYSPSIGMETAETNTPSFHSSPYSAFSPFTSEHPSPLSNASPLHPSSLHSNGSPIHSSPLQPSPPQHSPLL